MLSQKMHLHCIKLKDTQNKIKHCRNDEIHVIFALHFHPPTAKLVRGGDFIWRQLPHNPSVVITEPGLADQGWVHTVYCQECPARIHQFRICNCYAETTSTWNILQEVHVHLPVNAETLKRKYHQVYKVSKCI